jgi:two-component system, cell cycle response regulator
MESLEILGPFVYLTNVAVGLVVLCFGFRIASGLSFSSQRLAARFVLAAVGLWVLAEVVEAVNGLISGGFASQAVVELMAEEPIELLVTGCAATALYLLYRSDKGEVAALRREAVTDALTNLSNQSFFRRAAFRRFENSLKHGFPIACLVLDVDEFKSYNDRFGHEAGNTVLQCVARVLQESARADDLVSRYGGDEFVILINSSLDEGVYVAERAREGVETHCSPGRDPSLYCPVTISVGVAVPSGSTRTLEDLVEVADEELYRAKRAGRNTVSVAEYHQSTGTE